LLACVVACGVGSGADSADERTEFPPEARQQYLRGNELQKKGKLDEALGAYDEAIKLGMAAFPRVHLQRASVHLNLKKFETAIALYTKFIEEFGLEQSCRH
jgi:tetratricopeptide (TPR) repeat protein